MHDRGIDQSALARELGVTQGAISKIVLGKTANSRLLPRIATHLGVSLAWLLGIEDDPEADLPDEWLSAEEREWIDLLRSLKPKDRQAVIQLTRSLAGCAPSPTVHAPRQEYKIEERA